MARAPLQVGDPVRIGHYRLSARLGVGGMGVVYLGVTWDGSPVAVKVLRPELADDQEFRHRFRREVSALTRVRGVGTVWVIWSSADGTSWTRSQVSGLTGGGGHAVAALAASGSAVTGIDSFQAQASQQFAVLNLPAG